MQIELTPEQDSIASRWVAAGRYPGRFAVVVSGLELLRRLEGARRALNGSRSEGLFQAQADGFFLVDLTHDPKGKKYEEDEAERVLDQVVQTSIEDKVFDCVDIGIEEALKIVDRREQAIVAFNNSLLSAVAESELNGYHELDDVLAEIDEIIEAEELKQRVPAAE